MNFPESAVLTSHSISKYSILPLHPPNLALRFRPRQKCAENEGLQREETDNVHVISHVSALMKGTRNFSAAFLLVDVHPVLLVLVEEAPPGFVDGQGAAVRVVEHVLVVLARQRSLHLRIEKRAWDI